MKMQDRTGWVLVLIVIFGLAFFLRTAGLMRGLPRIYGYHPDEPKQVVAVEQFLNGRYVWYVETPYYDGYPLALNHLDEWLMRPALFLRGLCARHLAPGLAGHVVPDRLALYWWVRALRAGYAMALMFLAWRLARRLFESRRAQALFLLLLAIAPLPIVVAHFATGDIGVDLFTAAALLALATYADRPQAKWIALSGAFVGVGFACKYQAALAAVALVLFLAAEAATQRSVRRAVRNGLLALVSGVTGAVLATPAFFINPRRTWVDMRTNFEFIRNYNVSREFLALPVVEQMRRSLQDNVPKTLDALGWSLFLIGLLGAGLAVAHWARAVRRHDSAAPRRAALWAALSVFPFPVLLISLAGKPDAQPFHSAYLQIPLILAAVYALKEVAGRGASGRLAALLLAGLSVAELGLKAEREHFFWVREDTLPYLEQMEHSLFRAASPADSQPASIKRAFLEPLGPSVFRNRTREVFSCHGPFWNALHAAPMPSVPWSLNDDWIFDNGPVFPRNDRLFSVEANRHAERHLVFYEPPGRITCGLRSGDSPVRVRLELGGAAQEALLPPHTQRLLDLQPRRWRYRQECGKHTWNTWLVPLHVKADNGPVWVNVMRDPRDVELFRLFGGESNRLPTWPADISDGAIVRALADTRYIESGAPVDLVADASAQLLGDMALPAGLYTIECDLWSEGAGTLTLDIGDDMSTRPLFRVRRDLPFTPGVQTLRLSFAKSFAPHAVALQASCSNSAARVTGWRLQPDAAGTMDAWRCWRDTGRRPDWLSAWPAGLMAKPTNWRSMEVLFGGQFRFRKLSLPARIRRGESFPAWFDVGAENLPSPTYKELGVFVHLRSEGRFAAAMNAPLWEAIVAQSVPMPLQIQVPPNLSPGRYELAIGVFNARTKGRLPVEGAGLSSQEKRRRHVLAGEMIVTE